MKKAFLLSFLLFSTGTAQDGPGQASVTGITFPGEGNPRSSPEFSITPATARVRHRLKGLDSHWTEPNEEMGLAVRFISEPNSPIDFLFFPVTGTSEGWNGEFGTSTYLQRQERIPIPEGTKLVQIVMSSSGPPQAVGVFAIKDLQVREIIGGESHTLMEKGALPGETTTVWNKSGTLPAMARQTNQSPAHLHIIDTDLTKHADWASPAMPVEGGELVVTWSEVHSIGLGGDRTIAYDRLPPGPYQFQVEELDIRGLPTGRITTLDFEVPRPLWQRPWFWFLIAALIALVTLLFMRSAVRRKVRRAIRHTRLIENERLRIAMDLHDDIGTQLSQISLISSHALMKAQDEEGRKSLQQIRDLTGKLAGSLSETVWMLSPKNNDLESLIGFLCRLASELCRTAHFRCRINADPVDEIIPVSQQFRHHFVLSVKEALHNAIKHSQGTEIQLEVKLVDHQLTVSVRDDGISFSQLQDNPGNGLGSLKRRMKELGGSFKIDNSGDRGLQVVMSAPIRQDDD